MVWSNDKIVEQIKSLWVKIGEIEKRLEEGSDDFKQIHKDIVEVKTQINMMMVSMTGFLSNTWKLIFALMTIVAGLVGIKLWTT